MFQEKPEVVSKSAGKVDKSVSKAANKSGNKSKSKNKGNNNSDLLDASDDMDADIKSGEENIDDDEIVDESEFNLQTKTDTKNEIDMEEKKNKMNYDDWFAIFLTIFTFNLEEMTSFFNLFGH